MARFPTRVTVALCALTAVLVIVLVPPAGRVQAAGMFGELRTPGQAAFAAGHRGDRSAAPENTLPAITLALDSALDFVEIDVRLSADRVPVLMHDETVDRTTNGIGKVSDLHAATLHALDAGSWFGPEFAGTRIPLFEEFVAILAPTDKKAIVELKDFWAEEDIVLLTDRIFAGGVQDRVVFASKDFGTIDNLRDAAESFGRIIIMRDLPIDPVGLAQFYDAIAILTTVHSLEVDPDAVGAMHEAGLGLLLYTLNRKDRWTEALALGVDGIITDKPAKLDSWLAATAPKRPGVAESQSLPHH